MKEEVTDEILHHLAAHPDGLSAPSLRACLRQRVSQPTLWRYLAALRARGLVTVEGKARATRYHATAPTGVGDLRSRRMHESVARQLVHNPELRTAARARLAKLRSVNPHGRPYHDRWEALLSGPLPDLLRAMTEVSEDATAMRRESPFSALVDPEERMRIFERTAAA